MSITLRSLKQGEATTQKLAEGTVPVFVEVTGPMTKELLQQFRVKVTLASRSRQPVLPIVLSSPGGSVMVATQMADVLDSIATPIATIAIGQAASAAAYILTAAGTRGMRYASPSARIMYHEVSSGTQGKISRQAASVNEGELLSEILMDRINYMMGKKKLASGDDYLQKLIAANGHVDLTFSANEALDEGFIDHVGIPEMAFDERTGLFTFGKFTADDYSKFKSDKETDRLGIRQHLYPSGKDAEERRQRMISGIRDGIADLNLKDVEDIHRQVRDLVGSKAALSARKGAKI